MHRKRGQSATSDVGASTDTSDSPTTQSAHLHDLFEQHNRALVYFLRAKLGSESEARDVAQEAYVRLLQLDRPDTVGFLRAYLYRVATNIAVDHLRRRSVRDRNASQAGMLFEQLQTRPGPESRALDAQQLDVVKASLGDLPAKCRKAFVLHFFAERSVSEIAHDMHVTERMVRYHIANGLAHCRAVLDAVDPQASP